jgi:hypothetical protein
LGRRGLDSAIPENLGSRSIDCEGLVVSGFALCGEKRGTENERSKPILMAGGLPSLQSRLLA